MLFDIPSTHYFGDACTLYRVGQKVRPQTRGHNSDKFSRILQKKKFTARFPGKFARNWLLKIPPILAYTYVATLPLMPENKRLTINYKVV